MKNSKNLVSQNYNVGLELTENSRNILFDLEIKEKIGHIQVTIPGRYSFDTIKKLKLNSSLGLVIHSNILNVFGHNDWSDLKIFSERLNELNPVRVIEHFTAFRSSECSKFGIYDKQNHGESFSKDKITMNIKLWQSMLNSPLAIENIPITEGVDEYFESLISIKANTNVEIVCDLPHFFISAIASGWSDKKIREIATLLNPVQLHIGGVKKIDNKWVDNHMSLNPIILEMANLYFPDVELVTLEQDSAVNVNLINTMLDLVNNKSISSRELKIPHGFVMSVNETNEMLSSPSNMWPENTKGIRKIDNKKFSDADVRNPILLFEKYSAFFFPFATLSQIEKNIDTEKAIEICSSLIASSICLASWICSNKETFVKLSYIDHHEIFDVYFDSVGNVLHECDRVDFLTVSCLNLKSNIQLELSVSNFEYSNAKEAM